MKHDAIVDQGIPIHERVPIPDDLIPEDSRVEIDAKIHAGYCKSPTPLNAYILRDLMATPVTMGRVMSMDELSNVQGRAWDDVDVSGICWMSSQNYLAAEYNVALNWLQFIQRNPPCIESQGLEPRNRGPKLI